jgi:hypothetical protein
MKHPPISNNPKLLSEWDFSKNTEIDPYTTTQGSPRKAFWKCSKGHSWFARVNTRLVSDCPICVGKGVLKENNTLWSRTDIQKFWDAKKIQLFDPVKTSRSSSQKIWCHCPDCGEEWEQKASQKANCKNCDERSLFLHSSLSVLFPKIANEWHTEKNLPLTPQTIFARSKEKVWWECNQGHTYKSSIRQRTVMKSSCPVCLGKKFDGINSFASEFPELLKEWDYEKNIALNPEELLPQSHKRVHWVCSRNHQWVMAINRRIATTDSGCPYCSLRIANAENNLALTHPFLAKEWDHEKNIGIDISSVTALKNISVNWRCRNGHSWNARINTRASGAQCPYCAGKIASEESNLAIEFPHVAEQWHQTKNEGKLASEFRPRSSQKVWWQCNRGHEWIAAISSRTSSSTGCPICKPSTSKAEIRVYSELKALFDDTEWRTKFHGKEIDVYIPSLKLAIEIDGYIWHLDKLSNDQNKNNFFEDHGLFVVRLRDEKLPSIGLNEFKFNSSDLDAEAWFNFVGWLLEQAPFQNDSQQILAKYLNNQRFVGEELYIAILSKLPSPLFERSIAEIHPHLSNQWDYEKNGVFTPDMFTPGSNEKVWWLCQNKHSWQASIASRSKGTSCPFCGKGLGSKRRPSPDHNLALVNPNLVKEWDFEKNDIAPTDVAPNSSLKVWWKCQEEHSWQAIISSRNKGRGCPYCKGNKVNEENSLQGTNPILAAEWHPKNTRLPSDVLQRSDYKAWWQCSVCNHEWEAKVYARAQGRGCVKCSHEKKRKKK